MVNSTKIIATALFAISLTVALMGYAAKNPHGNLKIDCKQCHTTASWEVKQEKIPFQHSRTGFLLLGGHKFVDCMSCHQSLIFSEIGTACADCHTDVHRGQLGINCEDCHSSQNWENRSDVFEQHNASAFPLLGVHAITDCEACHVNQQQNEFANTPTDCEFCHQQELVATTSPNHIEEGLTSDCQRCHLPTANDWARASYKHRSAFVERGPHAKLPCSSCHSNNFSDISSDCYSCHAGDYNRTTDPNHIVFGFLTDCQLCHTDLQWDGARFDHLQMANFELRGAHSTIKCGQCHIDNQVNNLPRDCFGCHQSDFNTVTEPNHVTNNFDHDCLQCHTESVWSPATFDHNKTQFPLVGAHASVSCADCHTNGYSNLATDCFSCHENDFNAVSNPNHVTNNFNHDCMQCHDQAKWTPSSFDHNNTQFPLVGAHTGVSCVDCHSSGYTNTASDCYSCHEQNFTSTTDPNHVTNNFSHDCLQCHDQTKWSPAFFDHNNTQFPLVGAHTGVSCVDCHSSGYTNTASECYSCHEQNFTSTTDPNHVTNNFNHDCLQCHDQAKWSPAFFDHNNTQFPLVGAHTNISCVDCHSSGYSNTASDCYSCHQSNFTATTDPNHVTNNFSHDCLQCHDQTKWSPATFDHNTTQFPLTGAHVNVACTNCHSSGYSNTAADCYSCHKSEYDQTNDPNHAAASFPTDCAQCHNTTNWGDANWDHDNQYFPINSGKHRGEWNTCADCHANTNDYGTFSCIDCHEHEKTRTDNQHIGEVRNYTYDSAACYNCHPQGKADN